MLCYVLKAVQTKPEHEQYWVSYIDALMQAGATDTVADALILGQKFGLRSELAQMLAAEFVKVLEATAEQKKLLQDAAFEALQTELTPRRNGSVSQTVCQKDAKPLMMFIRVFGVFFTLFLQLSLDLA